LRRVETEFGLAFSFTSVGPRRLASGSFAVGGNGGQVVLRSFA
jgi:hypothetical protein